MGGPFPPESTPSWVGFGADLASAARALVNQPSVPLVSLAVTLLVGALPTGRQFFFITDAVNVAVFLFLLGWYGAERVFFQRHLEGRPVTLRHLVRLVPAFFTRAPDTWDDRTTRVPYSSAGSGADACVPRNRNDPRPSLAATASARRFMRAANIALRITHAVGASTASGSLLSIRATSAGVNVSPLVPVVLAVWVLIPE